MEVAAQFPQHPCEPWHAVFQGSTTIIKDVIHSARTYGSYIVEIGLAHDYVLISIAGEIEDEMHVHCIPHSRGKHMYDYLEQLYSNTAVDNNADV